MRIKILLSAVAALALGLASSSAQVYSANVVGYYNLNLTNGFNLICNQMDRDGYGTNNTVQQVFGTQLPNNSVVYAFSGGLFANPAAQYTSKGGWGGGTNAADVAVNPGQGVFVFLPSTAPHSNNVTFVGTVMQGNLHTPISAGYNVASSQIPLSGLMQHALNYSPSNNDVVNIWLPVSQAYTNPASQYTTKGGWSTEPNLSLGQAVFLYSVKGGNWNTNYTVQ